MVSGNIVPCKDCSDRHLRCHSSCTKYIEWKAHHEEQRELRRVERRIIKAPDDYFIQRKIKRAEMRKR